MACDSLTGGWDTYGPCFLHPRRPGRPDWPWPAAPKPRGFTLVELLVVIVIIGLISLATLPVVLPAWNHREVTSAAQTVQIAIHGARDRAAALGRPCGVRLLPDASLGFIGGDYLPDGVTPNPHAGIPDPTQILAYDRLIPLESAPSYNEGNCTPITPGTVAYLGAAGVPVGNYPPGGAPLDANGNPLCLVLVESAVNPTTGAPNPPTSWFWNIRVGDKVQLNSAGPWYTVIGPTFVAPGNPDPQYQGNSEGFVNVGPPGASPSLTVPTVGGRPVEYLLLVNGVDDNKNGFPDEGYDGIDNNSNGKKDLADPLEWVPNLLFDPSIQPHGGYLIFGETEAWLGSVASHTQVNLPYTVRRRPVPSQNAREVALPSSMVIDATTWGSSRERSRLPVDPNTGFVDIVVNPDGTVVPTTVYSAPSSSGMGSAWLHFWLAERQDVTAPHEDANGNILPWVAGVPYTLPIADPGSDAALLPGPYLKGERLLVSLSLRSGLTVLSRNPPALLDMGTSQQPGIGYNAQRGTWGASYPFIQAEQGGQGSP